MFGASVSKMESDASFAVFFFDLVFFGLVEAGGSAKMSSRVRIRSREKTHGEWCGL